MSEVVRGSTRSDLKKSWFIKIWRLKERIETGEDLGVAEKRGMKMFSSLKNLLQGNNNHNRNKKQYALLNPEILKESLRSLLGNMDRRNVVGSDKVFV
jgi:hypothetical protein